MESRILRREGHHALGAISLAVLLGLGSTGAQASSHRGAPLITGLPKVDATDFYMFRSYEPGREDYVTLLANYLPLQDAYGGPNYFRLDPTALYEIHIDNDGDAQEDITFQFRFRNLYSGVTLSVGGEDVEIPLTQAGPITSVQAETLNVKERYSVSVVTGGRRSGSRQAVTGVGSGATDFAKPVDNIGGKTFGSLAYDGYAAQHVYDVNIPNCPDPGRVFVGQRKDPFALPLGRIFDLINLNPLGPVSGGYGDDLADKNVTTLSLEVSRGCLTQGNEPVIGAWTTASLRQGRVLDPLPANGIGQSAFNGGAWTQVSRLGMPLVNEVVIGLGDKDRFNASHPGDDAQFATYVTNPTLPALIETLFPSAPAPTNFPRTDLVAAFLTGIRLADGTVVNRPANVVPAEMLRLNTAVAPTAAASQSNLGVAGNDLAGFPNGRRPGDDVVDIELRVAMGALCALSGSGDALGVGCTPADAPAGGAAITDGVQTDASQFGLVFPYLNTPLPGVASN